MNETRSPEEFVDDLIADGDMKTLKHLALESFALKKPPAAGQVTDSERLVVTLYRIHEALADLDHRLPLTWWDRLRGRKLGRRGIGWASAHHSLQKALAGLQMPLGPDLEWAKRKPEVKETERRLYLEHGGTLHDAG